MINADISDNKLRSACQPELLIMDNIGKHYPNMRPIQGKYKLTN